MTWPVGRRSRDPSTATPRRERNKEDIGKWRGEEKRESERARKRIKKGEAIQRREREEKKMVSAERRVLSIRKPHPAKRVMD